MNWAILWARHQIRYFHFNFNQGLSEFLVAKNRNQSILYYPQYTRSHNVPSQSFSTSLLIEFCIQGSKWVTGLAVSTALERHNGTDNVSGLIIKHSGSWWQLLLLIKKLHLPKREEGFRPDRTSDCGTAHLSYKLM